MKSRIINKTKTLKLSSKHGQQWRGGAHLFSVVGWPQCKLENCCWTRAMSKLNEIIVRVLGKRTVGCTYTAQRTNRQAPPRVLSAQINRRNCVASPQLQSKPKDNKGTLESMLRPNSVVNVLNVTVSQNKMLIIYPRETAFSANISCERRVLTFSE